MRRFLSFFMLFVMIYVNNVICSAANFSASMSAPIDLSGKALEYYEKAQKGDAEAQFQLGLCYYNGENGAEEDNDQAFAWFSKAGSQGHADAIYYIGNCYNGGYGVEKDYNKAIEYYHQAVNKGSNKAMNKIGLCYWNGEGVAKDYNIANDWFLKAGEAGNEYGYSNLGNSYRDGDGVEKDLNKALELYAKADSIKERYRLESYSVWSKNNNQHQIEKDCLDLIYKKSGISAITKLANCYYNGTSYNDIEIEEDKKHAFVYYGIASSVGDVDAMPKLGDCYLNGIGCQKNIEEAIKWYKKATELGNTDGQRGLGDYYKEIDNYESALEWYKKAAALGNAEAMNSIANIYKYKYRDTDEAIKWYKKEYEITKSEATAFLLGTEYEIFKRDGNNAIYWYDKGDNKQRVVELMNKGYSFPDVNPVEVSNLRNAIVGEWKLNKKENDYVISCLLKFNSDGLSQCDLILDASDGKTFKLKLSVLMPGKYNLDGNQITSTFDQSRIKYSQEGPTLMNGTANEQARFEKQTQQIVDYLKNVLYNFIPQLAGPASCGNVWIYKNYMKIQNTAFYNESHADNLVPRQTVTQSQAPKGTSSKKTGKRARKR